MPITACFQIHCASEYTHPTPCLAQPLSEAQDIHSTERSSRSPLQAACSGQSGSFPLQSMAGFRLFEGAAAQAKEAGEQRLTAQWQVVFGVGLRARSPKKSQSHSLRELGIDARPVSRQQETPVPCRKLQDKSPCIAFRYIPPPVPPRHTPSVSSFLKSPFSQLPPAHFSIGFPCHAPTPSVTQPTYHPPAPKNNPYGKVNSAHPSHPSAPTTVPLTPSFLSVAFSCCFSKSGLSIYAGFFDVFRCVSLFFDVHRSMRTIRCPQYIAFKPPLCSPFASLTPKSLLINA